MLHSALEMLKPFRFWLIGGVLVLLTTPFLAAQDFTSAAAQLAARISERSKPASASIAVTNRSSVGSSSVSSIHDELVRQLQLRGWNLQSPGGEASIAVTLSETPHTYVWTAEITRAGARDVAMVELPRSGGSASTQAGVTLSQTLLISSDTRLLDVGLVEGNISEGAHLLALTPASIELYQLQSSQWRLLQTRPLGMAPLPSRDLRGRIVPGENRSFDAFLPGLHCSGIATETVSFTCGQSDDPWPLSDDRRVLAFYAANRNFFNGVLSGTNAQNGNVKPFFSAAVLSDRVIYADADGVHYDIVINGQRPVSIEVQRGSSIAGIQSACQPDLVLANDHADYRDSIIALRQTGSDFSPVSEPVSFPGPVLSLKTTADHQQVLAISSSSGRYEAYLVAARCGH